MNNCVISGNTATMDPILGSLEPYVETKATTTPAMSALIRNVTMDSILTTLWAGFPFITLFGFPFHAITSAPPEEQTISVMKGGKEAKITLNRPAKSESWYHSIGQGMGKTITYTEEKQGYTLTDRGTCIAYNTAKNQLLTWRSCTRVMKDWPTSTALSRSIRKNIRT